MKWHAGIAAVVLGGVAVLGFVDRDLPGALVRESGWISRATPVVWLLAALAAGARAAGARRLSRVGGWLLLGAFAVFVAGEELDWPFLSVGYLVPGYGNFHDSLIATVLVGLRALGRAWPAPAVAGLLGIAAGAVALARSRRFRRTMEAPPAPHLLLSVGFLVTAALLDVVTDAHLRDPRVPYVMGTWPLEETLELLAGVAFLGAPLAGGPAPGRPSR